MKRFNKLSVKLVFVTIIITAVLIFLFTTYLIRDRARQVNEMILQKGIAAAETGSHIAGDILDNVIDNGFFNVQQVFDFRYLPVEFPENITAGYKNVPEKELATITKYHYVTGLDSYLANILLKIEDSFMEDPQVKYAVLVDINGYIPVHNSYYNKKLTGDFVYDRNFNRTKRKYTDEVGLRACENWDKNYLMQVYKRDTGEVMWDISSPVFVKGRHWGCFRVGLLIENIQRELFALKLKMIIIMCLLLTVLALVITRITALIMKPLGILHKGVHRVAGGDLSFEQKFTSGDEISDLGNAFSRMVADLKNYIEKLKNTTAAKERMESELKIAHDIQMGIVPKLFPPFPDKPNLDLYAVLEPAREVGGDFYDFFFLDDENLCFVIGDVSDKGVPSSLLMAVTVTLIKTTAREVRSPEEILNRVNNEIAYNNQSCMFITVFCGIINLKTGKLDYANAGHNPPLLIKESGANFIPCATSPALGIIENLSYKKETLFLSAGDVLFLYTDGVTEAFNERNELFSSERLRNELSDCHNISTRDLINKTLKAVKTFTGSAPQSDDITILDIRNPPEYNNQLNVKDTGKNITLKNDISEINNLAFFIETIGKENRFPEKLVYNLNLVLEEIVTNIISYGYEDKKEHLITVKAEVREKEIVLTVEDDARPFNPLKIPAPDTTAPVEERAAGGLGLFFVRKFMDKIEYKREYQKNIFVLTKNIMI